MYDRALSELEVIAIANNTVAVTCDFDGGGCGLSDINLLMAQGDLVAGVAFLTDGRFSGGSHGFIVGHVTPEAQEGGPLGLIRDDDMITIDAETNKLDVDVSAAEMEVRKAAWQAPPYKATRGTLYKYIKNVKNASQRCVTDE